MPFQDKLVGNPMLPALHGGVVGALMELTALTQLATQPIHFETGFTRTELARYDRRLTGAWGRTGNALVTLEGFAASTDQAQVGRVLEVGDGKLRVAASWEAHSQAVSGLAFLNDGRLVGTCIGEGRFSGLAVGMFRRVCRYALVIFLRVVSYYSLALKLGCNNPRQAFSCLLSCLHIENSRPSAGSSPLN